ncbi:MAG TPA: hypothetical protein VG013_31300 [Gemmataceae bacterium]|jgi:hypothetical protein|nr:hypothetical protein [Gemmataceae bacterium]
MITGTENVRDEARYESWKHWPVNWTAVWVGTLAALAVGLIIGLFGIAVGANEARMGERLFDAAHPWAMVWAILGSFFSFVVGGWCTAKVAGILRSEPAILHAAIAWLIAVPLFVGFAAVGAGSYFGGWHGGLAGSPAWSAGVQKPLPPPRSAPQMQKDQFDIAMEHYDADTDRAARVARNSAIAAAIALLVGLVGAVIGGWMGCGEPMTFSYYRMRQLAGMTAHPASQPAAVTQEPFSRR